MVIDGVTDLNASGTVGLPIPMVIDGINRLQCKWNVLAQLYLRSLMAFRPQCKWNVFAQLQSLMALIDHNASGMCWPSYGP